jgi:putative membrane protein
MPMPALGDNKNSQIGVKQMKQILTLICCFSLFSIAGAAQKKSSHPSMSDQQFVDFAGQTDMVDANLGQLANTAASSHPVKDYGQELVSDQTKDFQQLSEAAHHSNLNVPSAIDKENDKTMIDPFQKLKGVAFDRRFAEKMIAGETKAIHIYKDEVSHAQNLDVRGYAEKALPVLETHLADLKKLEKAKPASKG